jgi:hypothetical protein
VSLTVQIDSARYRNALNDFVYRLNADAATLLKEEMRLLLRDIIRFTPPNNKKQGEGAIGGDLFGGKRKSGARYSSIGLFQRIGQSTLQPPRKNGQSGLTGRVNLGWERSKTIRIYRKFWKPNASLSEMEAFHKRYQNPRTGRTGHISQSVIGRWKVQDQMWVSDSAAAAYFKSLASRVGFTKAGWLKAAIRVGLNVPSWIGRHVAYARGDYNPPTANKLEIEAINRSSKIPNYYERHVYPAMQSRVRSIESEVKRLLSGGKSRRGSLANTPTGQA